MSEQSTALQTVWLLGGNVSGSLSPLLHKSAYKAMGLSYTYAACNVSPAMLEAFLLNLQCYGAIGCNITAPYKESVYRILSQDHTDLVAELSEEVRRCGSVNTIKFNRDGMCGYSTDGQGWLNSFNEQFGVSLEHRPVVLIGAGGVARGLLSVLLNQKAGPIYIVNRTEANALAMIEALDTQGACVYAGPQWEQNLPPDTLVLQATTCSDFSLDKLFNWNIEIPRGVIACDVTYGGALSNFLHMARSKGIPCINGIGMLVHQAALGIKVWFGDTAPIDVMLGSIPHDYMIGAKLSQADRDNLSGRESS